MTLANPNPLRTNFGSVDLPLEHPDFLDIQLRSFQEFFQLETNPENRMTEGLFKVFSENFPITDTRNQFVLEFLDYFIDPPRYSIQECIERGLTYSVPLKAKLKLYCTDPEHEDFETIVQDVYLGTIPYMTPQGSFVINGAERVIVNQLHRSPGVFFGQSRHANGRPNTRFKPAFVTLTSSAKLKMPRMSRSVSYPMLRNNVVTGSFFFRSMYAYITPLMSVANSIQDPLNGIIRAECNLVPLACRLWPKNTPGERCNWLTITRSAPFTTNEPWGVM